MITEELIGQSVGDYQLQRVLGQGGLATVFLAEQSRIGRRVAVKILHHQGQNSVRRFTREAQAIANLRHPHILSIYSYGEHDNYPYMVMEYVTGGTLEDLIEAKTLEEEDMLQVVVRVCQALGYAHERGMVHRDVKPSNILMSKPDWPLLADFGLVKLSPDWDPETLTIQGMSVGTPSYISPEQARGEEVDHRTDIYAMGIILYQLATGQLPFNYRNRNRILLAQISETPPPPNQVAPNCPPQLTNIILRAMAKDAEQRYQSMEALVLALNKAASVLKNRTVAMMPATLPQTERTVVEPMKQRKAHIRLTESGQVVLLPTKQRVIVGRSHGNKIADIDLGPHGGKEGGVSRHHALLIHHRDRWMVDDLQSLNGTFVNGAKITPRRPIVVQHGDSVRCSQVEFILHLP